MKREKVVFVDPQDPNLPFWPAIIIDEEYKDFCNFCLSKQILPPPKPKHDSILVVYFEDLSFSVCKGSEVVDISEALRKFPENFIDLQYKKALDYHRNGVLPAEFGWIKYSHLPSPSQSLAQSEEREVLEIPIVRKRKMWLKEYLATKNAMLDL